MAQKKGTQENASKKEKLTPNSPTGKCIKALREIRRQHEDSHDVCARMKVVHAVLIEIVDQKEVNLGKEEPKEQIILQTKYHSLQNRTCALEGLPERLEFTVNGLRFYVDFIVLPSSSNELPDLEGGIVYGAQRAQCFASCDIGSKHNSTSPKHVVALMRCDGLEDKPLLKLSIDDHGKITESDKIDDEWWIGKSEGECADWVADAETKKSLQEMHCRVLRVIWRDALNWVNERLLP